MKKTRIDSVADAEALVGQVWEREGKQREIVRVENLRISPYDRRTVLGDIYWRIPGKKTRKQPTDAPTFRAWLSKASRVEA